MLKVVGPIVKGAAVREREVLLGDGKGTMHGSLPCLPCLDFMSRPSGNRRVSGSFWALAEEVLFVGCVLLRFYMDIWENCSGP